ncbi:heme-binding protein, partial [Salmonella enterica]|nr:heme-binding protein [Salmonella enterica]
MKRILSGALLMGCIVPIASATDVVLSQKNLSFHIADKLAQNVLLVCARDNYNVAV